MAQKDGSDVEKMLDDAKDLDLEEVIILGLDNESEAHMLRNMDPVTALQILELFRSNLITSILKEVLSGGFHTKH